MKALYAVLALCLLASSVACSGDKPKPTKAPAAECKLEGAWVKPMDTDKEQPDASKRRMLTVDFVKSDKFVNGTGSFQIGQQEAVMSTLRLSQTKAYAIEGGGTDTAKWTFGANNEDCKVSFADACSAIKLDCPSGAPLMLTRKK